MRIESHNLETPNTKDADEFCIMRHHLLSWKEVLSIRRKSETSQY